MVPVTLTKASLNSIFKIVWIHYVRLVWRLDAFSLNFVLQCHYFTNISPALFSKLQLVNPNIEKSGDNEMVWLFLYDSPKFNSDQNLKTWSSCISFILKSERLDDSLSQRQLEVVDNNNMVELHTYSVWQSCKYSLLLSQLLLSMILRYENYEVVLCFILIILWCFEL